MIPSGRECAELCPSMKDFVRDVLFAAADELVEKIAEIQEREDKIQQALWILFRDAQKNVLDNAITQLKTAP